MKVSIQKFTFLLIGFLILSLLTIFSYFYLEQQDKASDIILQNLKSELAETNYVISKNLSDPSAVSSHRSLLDRVVANNSFIFSALIHNGHKVLLTTDPFHDKVLPTSELQNSEQRFFNKLIKTKAIEEKIRFYVNGKQELLHLMFVLDQEEIRLFFNQKDSELLFFFIMIPLIIIFLVWLIVRKFIIAPLELLRQFSYYHSKVPKKFALRELETIRHSMVETFQRLENEKKELYAIARTDALSGLSNRNALMEYLERLIGSCKRDGKEFAMLFLDLDHFKTVNDSLGHNVGDELLKEVSSVIDSVLRSQDFVARVGGDEFVIILQEYSSLYELRLVIERIQNVLEETWIIQSHPIMISSSIGVAFYPKDGEDTITLMKNSDIAMYEAKKNGRSRYHFFTKELNARVQETIQLEKEMKKALANNEYQLYYQPKVDISTDKIVGAEALIRWIHPSKGMVSPDAFISLAEEDGFIIELGTWIYENAIKQQRLFKEKGIDIQISINLSPKQLLVDSFFEDFVACMEREQVIPSAIDVEITENLFLQHNNKNIKALNAFSKHGISISLDDFGTGYSSLSYLKDFPIDNIKIDKAFLDGYCENHGRVFVETIVKMGQTLQMKIIAEGVEEQDQVEYLKSIDCDQYQGYFCSKPLNAKEFEDFYLSKR